MTMDIVDKIARAIAPFYGKPFDELPATRKTRFGLFYYRHRGPTQEDHLEAATAAVRVLVAKRAVIIGKHSD